MRSSIYFDLVDFKVDVVATPWKEKIQGENYNNSDALCERMLLLLLFR